MGWHKLMANAVKMKKCAKWRGLDNKPFVREIFRTIGASYALS